jgi:hypothetical protein
MMSSIDHVNRVLDYSSSVLLFLSVRFGYNTVLLQYIVDQYNRGGCVDVIFVRKLENGIDNHIKGRVDTA